jgi:hypothetical protein
MPATEKGFNTTTFRIFMLQPGDLNFYKINWSKERFSAAPEFQASSAPNDMKD